MKRIEELRVSRIILNIFILLFVYSCEEQTTAEITESEVENQILESSEADKIPHSLEQTLEWCVFGNYCDATGRHYPANFRVSIWNYSEGEKQESLYSDVSNAVELNEDGDYAGTPICFDLPNSTETDEFYVEITLLSSEAYGEISESIIREGVLDESEIKNLFKGEDKLDYFHFREGCDSLDTPALFSN